MTEFDRIIRSTAAAGFRLGLAVMFASFSAVLVVLGFAQATGRSLGFWPFAVGASVTTGIAAGAWAAYVTLQWERERDEDEGDEISLTPVQPAAPGQEFQVWRRAGAAIRIDRLGMTEAEIAAVARVVARDQAANLSHAVLQAAGVVGDRANRDEAKKTKAIQEKWIRAGFAEEKGRATAFTSDGLEFLAEKEGE